MSTKHIILMACAAPLGAMQVNAQEQDPSILTANTDARTATMSNTSAAAEGMYLYDSPATIFATDKELTIGVSVALFEKTEGAEGAFAIYALSVGHKLAKRHTVFAGFRYVGRLSLKGSDLLGNPTKNYKPYNWTLDLGYTYFLDKGFAAYATGSLVYSHLSKNATGAIFGVGGVYRNSELTPINKPTNLMLDAKVGAIGPQLDYGNKHRTTLPTYLAIGGTLSVEVAEKHQAVAALSPRCFSQPLKAKLLMPGGGLEHTYDKTASIRAGYEYGDHNLGRVTMGAGSKYHGLHLNGAYSLETTDTGSSYRTMSIGYDF